MPRAVYLVIALCILVICHCAIDVPEGVSPVRAGASLPPASCLFRFSLADSLPAYFRSAGNINGSAVTGTVYASLSVSSVAPLVRELRLSGSDFLAVASLSSPSLGLRTIQAGNPEFHIYAFSCSGYCTTEKYFAGDYSGTLRGSGTLEITGGSGNPTQITLNAALPAENTSVPQTMQFQSLVLTEICQ